MARLATVTAAAQEFGLNISTLGNRAQRINPALEMPSAKIMKPSFAQRHAAGVMV